MDAAIERCSTCGQEKLLDDFNRLARSKDGRQWNCRACNAAYHQANKERHNAQIKARRRRVREELKSRLLDYMVERGCADCGTHDPLVLEFDHLRDKSANIGRLRQNCDWPRLLRELEKCDVVCANRHRRRTYRRMTTYRLRSE